MTSLQKFKVKGKSYYRLVESQRIGGKPTPVPILYLGTAESILEKLSKGAEVELKSYEHGSISAIKSIIDELGLEEIIDNHSEIEGTGRAIILAAMHRLVQPGSKRSWQDWAGRTSIFKLFPGIQLKKFSSQYFWKRMRGIPISAIPKIEEELFVKGVKEYSIELDTLFFDTTNCYTYINDHNERCTLARYGRSKEKRNDKRIFGVSLMVSRQEQFPLFHKTFPGNSNDTKQFPEALRSITKRVKKLGLELSTITLVFDRGFNSERNFKAVKKEGLGLVAALKTTDVSDDIFQTPLRRFKKMKTGDFKGLQFFRRKYELHDTEYTAVLYNSETCRELQAKNLDKRLSQKLSELEQWQMQIKDHTTRAEGWDDKTVKQRIKRLLAGEHISNILSIEYNKELPLEQRLKFSVDYEKKAEIVRTELGRRVLVTNQHDWSTEDIIRSYFGLYNVEHSFRACKDDYHICIRPQFHWTDHNIIINNLICFISLVIGKALQLKVSADNLSLPAILNTLSDIRLVAVIDKNLKKPTCSWKLEQTTPEALKLFQTLVSEKNKLVQI